MPSVGKRKPWWRENLSLKLISLILAVLLELYFYSPDNSVTVTVPATVDIRNVPGSLTIINPRHGERGVPARIEVRGPRPLIEQVRSTTQRFVVEYPPEHPMVFTAALDHRQLWLPAGVEVLEVNPPVVNIELERLAQKQVMVELEKAGQLADGYQLDGISLTPDSISVSGPEGEVAPLKSIRTQRLNLEGISETRRFELGLVSPGQYSKLSNQTVTAEVRVSVIPAERTFEKVNVQVVSPYGYAGTVEPSRVRVVLAGPKQDLEKLSPGAIELQADGRELREGRHELNVTGNLPAGISVLSTEPKKVTVNLVKQQ